MRFILVDKIIDMVPGEWARGTKYIARDEDYFADHFPGFPVVPGVLLTEMMAQTAGKCLNADRYGKEYAMLAQITSAKFLKWIKPESHLEMYAEIKNNKPRFATARCKITCEEDLVCSADLFFTFIPEDSFLKNYHDDVLESFLKKKTHE
jgi:3-hydroxyacyl-[acyl-carrier-protein] dehydratase